MVRSPVVAAAASVTDSASLQRPSWRRLFEWSEENGGSALSIRFEGRRSAVACSREERDRVSCALRSSPVVCSTARLSGILRSLTVLSKLLSDDNTQLGLHSTPLATPCGLAWPGDRFERRESESGLLLRCWWLCCTRSLRSASSSPPRIRLHSCCTQRQAAQRVKLAPTRDLHEQARQAHERVQ